jgi:CheY-like chemotaxis protein
MISRNKNNRHSVLLVDDSEVDNLINERIIKNSGVDIDVHVTVNGEEALRFIKKILSNKNHDLLPDYIFLDINMPVMDGFEFLNEIEQIDKAAVERCKVIILTSSENPEDLKKAQTYKSVFSFVTKPLNRNTLLDVIENF